VREHLSKGMGAAGAAGDRQRRQTGEHYVAETREAVLLDVAGGGRSGADHRAMALLKIVTSKADLPLMATRRLQP